MKLYRGSVLRPSEGSWTFIADAGIAVSRQGEVEWVSDFAFRPASEEGGFEPVGLLTPPLVDCHIHVPQFPIRGRFLEGVAPPGGLLEGLERNVYPAEMRCADVEHATEVTRQFLDDTRAHGTLGGVAYMTSHPVAVRAALHLLPKSWRVGLVLMDQNCPTGLHITESEAEVSYRSLAREFGDRVVVTDRFAVACSSRLRALAARIASELKLTTQTHLSEQPGELSRVRELYPDAEHYTGVYVRDGLLGHGSLLAHCIHLSEAEWKILANLECVVCHCPVSNTLLGSGTLDLRELQRFGLGWTLCTDVGASPSTSLLGELKHFLAVHAGTPWSHLATAEAGLWHATIAARDLGRVRIGGLERGKRFAAVEFDRARDLSTGSPPGDVIRSLLRGEAPARARRWWM